MNSVSPPDSFRNAKVKKKNNSVAVCALFRIKPHTSHVHCQKGGSFDFPSNNFQLQGHSPFVARVSGFTMSASSGAAPSSATADSEYILIG